MQIFHQEIPYALFSLIPVQWHQHDLCPHNFKNYKKKTTHQSEYEKQLPQK